MSRKYLCFIVLPIKDKHRWRKGSEWCVPRVLATSEADAGESFEYRSLEAVWAT
jgi:hypothetical protein